MHPNVEEISRVACVGVGTIGMGWATYFLSRGMEVVVYDPDPGVETALRRFVEHAWPRLETLSGGTLGIPKDIVVAKSVEEAVEEAQFVQESAPEFESLKVDLVADIDAVLPEEFVIASSSSRLLPSRISARCRHRDRCIIGHPFSPTHLLPLVEVLVADGSPRETRQWACDFYAHIGKQPIALECEVEGYIVNRLQRAIITEANLLVDRGVCTYADIDSAIVHSAGIRWAFMGLSTYLHLAGGRGGIDHNLSHFGWFGSEKSKHSLLDAVALVAENVSMDELEHWRDENVLAILTHRRTLESLPTPSHKMPGEEGDEKSLRPAVNDFGERQ